MSELSRVAAQVARLAGAHVAQAYRAGGAEISKKGTIDLVTQVDRASETLIVDELSRRFPSHTIVAEESGLHERAGDVRWIVDPLDGTVNFAHGVPHFCVLVAAQTRDAAGAWQTVAGATYEPLRDELFLAARGEGATLNGRPIRVSTTSRLIESMGATGFSYHRLSRVDDNHAEFARLNLLTRGLRRFGSAGLDLAWVACGRVDFYWEYDLNLWDIAPGVLLVQEAGGVVTDVLGGPYDPATRSANACGPALHATLVAELRRARELPMGSREGM